MELRYDFHIHSCLSPCAEADMTPYNIAAMAAMLELDIIAITDHNTTGNCRATIQASSGTGLLVIPGMELCTAEEIHIVCLFPHIDSAEAFGSYVYDRIPDYKNNPEIFGPQNYMDSGENILRSEAKLLITATSISIDHVPALCRKYGGVSFPAHIDRSSNSLISNFGYIDPSLDFAYMEIADPDKTASLLESHPILGEKTLLYSSDSHRLETLAVMDHHTISLDRVSPRALMEWFNYKR